MGSIAGGAVADGAVPVRIRSAPSRSILVFLTGARQPHRHVRPEARRARGDPRRVQADRHAACPACTSASTCRGSPRGPTSTPSSARCRHRDNNHLVATHHVLTGHQQPGAFFDKVASRDDWPCYAAALDYLGPRDDGVPSGVNLPTFLMEGPLIWPGQHAGFLGPKHDPWQITRDPNAPDFRVDNLRLPPGLDVDRLERPPGAARARSTGSSGGSATPAEGRRLTDQQQLAFSMLTSGRVAQAFDLDREPAAVRDRYGRHAFGQSLLLARRLVEAGVPVVQANMGRVQNWDTHGDNFRRLKDQLLPPLDQGVRPCSTTWRAACSTRRW